MSAFGVWLRQQRRRYDPTGRAASLVDAYEVEAWDDSWGSWESAVLTAARANVGAELKGSYFEQARLNLIDASTEKQRRMFA